MELFEVRFTEILCIMKEEKSGHKLVEYKSVKDFFLKDPEIRFIEKNDQKVMSPKHDANIYIYENGNTLKRYARSSNAGLRVTKKCVCGETKNLHFCTNCYSYFYCNKNCQDLDYAQHNIWCCNVEKVFETESNRVNKLLNINEIYDKYSAFVESCLQHHMKYLIRYSKWTFNHIREKNYGRAYVTKFFRSIDDLEKLKACEIRTAVEKPNVDTSAKIMNKLCASFNPENELLIVLIYCDDEYFIIKSEIIKIPGV